jgi:hypothetical protein
MGLRPFTRVEKEVCGWPRADPTSWTSGAARG